MDVVAQAKRLPRPGETLLGSSLSTIPGGKGAKQAVAARRSGADVQLVGAVGSDVFADNLVAFLEDESLDLTALARAEATTGTALIVVEESGENFIVIVPGANDCVTPDTLSSLQLEPGDVVLLQNEIPEATNVAAARLAHGSGALAILNLAPFRPTTADLLDGVDYLVVNEHEFSQVLKLPRAGDMTAARVAGLLAEGVLPSTNLVVTLGPDGVQARLQDRVSRLAGHEVAVVDTTGAGDCFCGAFGSALAGGATAADALEFANAAAALSVQQLGAGPSMPLRKETLAFLAKS